MTTLLYLIADIRAILEANPNNEKAIQAVHDLMALQMCTMALPGCQVTDYDNDLPLLLSFYEGLTDEAYDWIHSPEIENSGIKHELIQFLIDGPMQPASDRAQHVNAVTEFLAEQQGSVQFSEEEIQWLLENPDEFPVVKQFILSHDGEPLLIGDDWYVLDSSGILHVYVPPIDMNSSTDLEILTQILLVIEKIHLYFCEGNSYEPIDWKDYFDNYHSVSGVVDWNDCQVGFDLTSLLQPYSIMETNPSWSQDNGSDWTYKWTGYNTNLPMLQITVDYGCTETIEDKMFPDCE